MEALERQTKRIQAATGAGQTPALPASVNGVSADAPTAVARGNREEIDIDAVMGEEGTEGKVEVVGDANLQVTAKPIPSAVFERAGLGSGDGEEGEGGGEDAVGALERLKKGKKSGT